MPREFIDFTTDYKAFFSPLQRAPEIYRKTKNSLRLLIADPTCSLCLAYLRLLRRKVSRTNLPAMKTA